VNELGPAHYLATFVASGLLTLVLVPVAMRVAVRHGVLDHPGGYKKQESPVPYLGGVAIVVAFSVGVLAAALLRPPVTGLGELGLIMGLALALALVGLIDDLKSLGAWPRLVVMIGASIWLWSAGVGVQLFDQPVLDGTLTVLWIVGITNAFNLLDNMDGLSAGVAAIAAGSFFLIAALNGQFLVAALSVGLAGCAVGFLRHNFHPARIYMGDAGSLFLGFMLAVLGLKLRFDAPREITFLVPIMVLGVAVFDTTLVTVTRIAHGLNPMAGGRDHTSHRLVFVGLPVRAAVAVIYGAAIGLGWVALVLSRLENSVTAYVLSSLPLTVGFTLGGALGAIPIYADEHSREPTRALDNFVVVSGPHPAAPSNRRESETEASEQRSVPTRRVRGRADGESDRSRSGR
jgi:UDP-GlcNAc:undecaprenyl-phosphate GlcNAc-1-phosphate transferase